MRSRLSALLICFTLCLKAHADPLDDIVKKISRSAAGLKDHHIAVLPFPYCDGSEEKSSWVISERLTTKFGGSKQWQVVERTLLDKVFRELNLEHSGAISQESVRQMGQLLGVEAIVTGTLIELDQNEIEVNARLIQAETGRVLATASQTIHVQWKHEPNQALPESDAALKNKMSAFFNSREVHPKAKLQIGESPRGFSRQRTGVVLSNADGTMVSGTKGREMFDSPSIFLKGLENSAESNALQTAWESSFIGNDLTGSMAEFAKLKMEFQQKHQPKLTALSQLYLAESYFAQGQLTEAIREARPLAKKEDWLKLKAYALYLLARCSESMGRPAIAFELYNEIIQQFPFETKLIQTAGYRLLPLRGARFNSSSKKGY